MPAGRFAAERDICSPQVSPQKTRAKDTKRRENLADATRAGQSRGAQTSPHGPPGRPDPHRQRASPEQETRGRRNLGALHNHLPGHLKAARPWTGATSQSAPAGHRGCGDLRAPRQLPDRTQPRQQVRREHSPRAAQQPRLSTGSCSGRPCQVCDSECPPLREHARKRPCMKGHGSDNSLASHPDDKG